MNVADVVREPRAADAPKAVADAMNVADVPKAVGDAMNVAGAGTEAR